MSDQNSSVARALMPLGSGGQNVVFAASRFTARRTTNDTTEPSSHVDGDVATGGAVGIVTPLHDDTVGAFQFLKRMAIRDVKAHTGTRDSEFVTYLTFTMAAPGIGVDAEVFQVSKLTFSLGPDIRTVVGKLIPTGNPSTIKVMTSPLRYSAGGSVARHEESYPVRKMVAEGSGYPVVRSPSCILSDSVATRVHRFKEYTRLRHALGHGLHRMDFLSSVYMAEYPKMELPIGSGGLRLRFYGAFLGLNSVISSLQKCTVTLGPAVSAKIMSVYKVEDHEWIEDGRRYSLPSVEIITGPFTQWASHVRDCRTHLCIVGDDNHCSPEYMATASVETMSVQHVVPPVLPTQVTAMQVDPVVTEIKKPIFFRFRAWIAQAASLLRRVRNHMP